MDNMSKEVSEFEGVLGLPQRFYDNLLNEDDWSFVIKLSALFEAASGQALSARLQHPEIESELSYLEQGNPKCGKVTFMLKLKIINKQQSVFLIKLAELRNKLVHNISEVNFDWDSYISSLDKNQKKSFANAFSHGLKKIIEVKSISTDRTTFTIENPKEAIWISARETLACLNVDIRDSKTTKKINTTVDILLQHIVNGKITIN